MAKTAKTKVFHVWGKLSLEISVDISAADLQDALTVAQGMEVHDFVKILGDYNDGVLKVTGLFEKD